MLTSIQEKKMFFLYLLIKVYYGLCEVGLMIGRDLNLKST